MPNLTWHEMGDYPVRTPIKELSTINCKNLKTYVITVQELHLGLGQNLDLVLHV